MKNKYYLKSVDFTNDIQTGHLYYTCVYSNGILEYLEFYTINITESINIPTIIYEPD
jgi:hypothetical protein